MQDGSLAAAKLTTHLERENKWHESLLKNSAGTVKIRRTGSCTYPTEGHVTPKIRHDFSPLIIDMPAQTSVHRKSSSTYGMTKVVWVQTTTSNKFPWPLSKTTAHDTLMIVLSFSPTLLSLSPWKYIKNVWQETLQWKSSFPGNAMFRNQAFCNISGLSCQV